MGIPCSLEPLGWIGRIKPNTVLYNKSGANRENLKLEAGYYLVEACGGGGGASYSVVAVTMGSGGGSGAYLKGYFRLPFGTYTAASGKKGDDSNMTSVAQGTVMPAGDKGGLLRIDTNEWVVGANGGTGATRSYPQGSGGTVMASSYQVGNLISSINGKAGAKGGPWSVGAGGASVFNGYGKGGTGNDPGSGTNGFLKITYLGAY